MRGALLFAPVLAGLLLAGCGAAKREPSITEKDAARAAELAKHQGWDKLFVGTQQTIAIANQFGYRNGEYAAAKDGSGFASTGATPAISSSYAKAPNTTGFTATGASADRLDRLVFTLDITDPDNAVTAKKRFRDILDQFLGQFGIDVKADTTKLVTDEVEGSRTYPGATLTVAKQEVKGAPPRSRRLVVTFERTGGTAPANSEPEAQGTNDGNRR
ncbi:MAG: hypothetical protein ACOY45_10095 [Pseudomonadota bacterium]